MPRAVFWTLVAVAVAFGLLVGSVIDRPPSKPMGAPTEARAEAFPTVNAHFHPAGTEPDAPKILLQGQDRQPGWEKRQALRDGLDAAMQSLMTKPCDPDMRAGFLAAYIKRTNAQLQDDRHFGEDGAPFWRTSDDDQQSQSIQRLINAGWFTQDELGEALFRNALGDGAFQRLQDEGRNHGAAYSGPAPDRCVAAWAPAAQLADRR